MLNDLLEDILGSSNVYFQPPENVKLKYPCIIYHLSDNFTFKADNKLYKNTNRYQITLVSRDPDDLRYSKLIELPMSVFDRFFVADNLNHWVFSLYY